jgi:hypothetical protein
MPDSFVKIHKTVANLNEATLRRLMVRAGNQVPLARLALEGLRQVVARAFSPGHAAQPRNCHLASGALRKSMMSAWRDSKSMSSVSVSPRLSRR